MSDAIMENGGDVKELDYKNKIHYSIVNMEGEGTLHAKAENHISHIFIEECLENEVSIFKILLRNNILFYSI